MIEADGHDGRGRRRGPGRVAIVTCATLPEPDLDEALLLDALRAAGLDAHTLAWDDPDGEPSRFDVCVLRSAWNYYEAPGRFAAWVERAARVSRVWNPVSVVRWNLHKRYLDDLRARSVPVVPTVFVNRGAPASLADIASVHGWNDVVVKPAVSASSFQTRRFRPGQLSAGQVFLQRLVAERDVMVQTYMRSVEDAGERCLVWIDGELTHAVRKSPRFGDDIEGVSGGLEISTDDRAFAERVLAAVDGDLLYARVDVVRDDDGSPCVSELELVEPSLYLVQSALALERLVGAIERLVRRP